VRVHACMCDTIESPSVYYTKRVSTSTQETVIMCLVGYCQFGLKPALEH